MVKDIRAQVAARRRENAGFTLMELLIVIAIISVLVAIAIPTFTAQLDNAKDAADRANARALYALAQAEWMDNGSNATDTNYEWNAGESKEVVKFGDGSTQSFTFSDRTSSVLVEFFDNGAHVTVGSLANEGAGFEYPEG